MEEWEKLLESYSPPKEAKEFSSILKTAEFTLAKELASFEEDFILKTLLKEPVSLILLLKEKNSDTSWSKMISDSLKLLSDVVMKCKLSDSYFEMITDLCSMSYDPQTNQQALHCLTSVIKRSQYGADNINRYLYALELGTSCKAQLAVLIGTLCEYHPDRVADDINTIWRVFLNLFDIGKYSTPVVKAILQGIQSMLKHFGSDLPMMELNIFYDKLVLCLDIERCTEVCASIIGEFAGLFRERLQDGRVHAHLWARISSPAVRNALRSVHREMEAESVQALLKDIRSYAESDSMNRKLTAMSILKELQDRDACNIDVGEYFDLAVLEFQLRNGTLTYDSADAISWCIEAGVYHSDRLLKVALITYDSIPAGKRPQIVQSLLKCSAERLPEIADFLVMESCRSPERFAPVWRQILDGKDPAGADHTARFVREVVHTVRLALDDPAVDWVEPLPEHIALLRLVWSVLLSRPSAALARPLLRCARVQCEAVPAAVVACYDSPDQPAISVERFTSDTALFNCGAALARAPDVSAFLSADLLKMLQALFHHRLADARTLTGALDKLEYLLSCGRRLDEPVLTDIYGRIQKIASGKADGKDARILRRDAIIFLGKHRRHIAPAVDSDLALMISLRERLVLDVPGNNMKIPLHKLLHLALTDENEDALRALLSIICDSLSIRKDASQQSALYRVLTSLSRFSIDLDTLRTCMSYCEPASAVELIRCISREKSPGSRELLLQGLEILLTGDLDEQALEEAVEQVLLCEELNRNEADILNVILKVLTNNNILIQKYILQIIYKSIKSHVDLSKTATEIFVNKIGLFDNLIIHNLIDEMFKVLNSIKYSEDVKVTLNVATLIKTVMDHSEGDRTQTLCDYIKREQVNLHALSCLKRVFEFTNDESDTLYTQNESYINGRLFGDDILENLDEKIEFLVEFSNTLLHRDEIVMFIVKIINHLSPNIAIKIYENLSKCLKQIKEGNQDTSIATVSKSLNEWAKKLPLEDIAQKVEDYFFELEDEKFVNAIKVITKAFNVNLLDHKDNLMRILDVIQKMLTSGYIKRCLESKMTHLNDLVELSMMVMNDDELKNILLEESGVEFCGTFILAVHGRLLRKPYLLLEPELSHAAILLNDIVKCTENDNVDNVLELVDEVWPTYITRSTFSQTHGLLLALSRLGLARESNPLRWLLRALDSQDTKTHERILLIDVIPGGEEYNSAYLSITSRLPTRLDEISGSRASYFRAILESLARHRNFKLLEIIVNLASSVDTPGWWDDALVVTAYALSAHEELGLCEELYRRLDGNALGASRRLLVPLLRFSKASLCEEFFSGALPHLLSTLEKRPREASTHYSYQKYLHDSIKAFTVLEVLFQKVPRQSIESSKSHLYHKITDKVGDSPYWIVKTACKLALTLRASVKCPSDADEKVKNSYRMFHCAIYKCLAAALCCRDPSADVYATAFDAKTWAELIDTQPLHLPVRYQWNRSSAHYTASASAQRAHSASLTRSLTAPLTRSLTASLTRDFSHTLSENPLQYDLQETQVQAQEVPVGDNPLNKHECGPSLTTLFRKVAPHTPNRPLQLLAAALAGELHANAKWLLAQAVCNCKEELEAHASVLRPALLALTANTASGVLNSVHVDVVDTIISWHDEEPPSCVDNLNSTVQLLISTCLDHKSPAVARSLLDKIEKLLEMYSGVLTVSGQFFKDRMVDVKSETTKRCIQILKRVTKAKIHIPELLPALVKAIEGKRVSPDVTELFGFALASTEQNAEAKRSLQTMLEKLRRSDAAEYVKLLYYTQKGYPKCCDEANFRKISDLLPKIVGREKQKCLLIIVAYVSQGGGQRSVDALPLREVMGEVAGLDLLRHSLPHIHYSQRSELVLQAARICDTPAKERQAAYKVILEAFELLVTTDASEPSLKRRAESSRICSLLRSTDEYVTTVLPLVGEAIASGTEAAGEVESLLSKDLNVRFCECFALAVYFPVKFGRCSNINRALGSVLTLFFSQTQQEDKRTSQPASSASSRVSMRTPSVLSALNLPDNRTLERNAAAFEVKTPEEVLRELLKCALTNPSVATVLCVHLVELYRGSKRPGFDFDDSLYDMLCQLLDVPCELTPCVMEMVVALRHWEPSLSGAVEKLCRLTIDSEADQLCRVFREDFHLHTLGPEQFVMGSSIDDDFIMSESPPEFSMEGLVSTFDKLSNWDNIPVQERDRLLSALPPLWTDAETFKCQIQDYQASADTPEWLAKMLAFHEGADADRLCFRSYHQWPRRMFDTSAMIELLDIEKLREEELVRLPEYIHPSECLAKAAARILMRRAILHEMEPSLCSGGVLRLCEVASGRQMYRLARDCAIDLTDLNESDTLKLFELKIAAERGLAVQKNDNGYSHAAHNVLEELRESFADATDADHTLRARLQTLLVARDMESLSKEDIDSAVRKISDVSTQKGRLTSKPNAEVVASICMLGVTHFDSMWDVSEPSERDHLMRSMCEILRVYLDQNLGAKWRYILDIMTCRLEHFTGNTMSEETALCFLNQIKNIQDIDDFSKDLIKRNMSVFPSHLHDLLSHLKCDDELTVKFKRCFQLVADVEHLLRDYCKWLGEAIDNNDPSLWAQTFANMKGKVFENPYAGADYQVLYKYKKILYPMEAFEPHNEENKRKLLEIEAQLKTNKSSLFLSQLCPVLCGEWTAEEAGCVASLMGLQRGVRVVKFINKVVVFSGALRRPVLLSARLSDGSVRRVIVKSGERAHQAAATRVLAALDRLYTPIDTPTHYTVTVLSEDCAMIEYLEDTIRLRSLIATAHPIDETLFNAQRGKSEELVLSPRAALSGYNQICARVPATVLRSAIQSSSISTEDFIMKKKNFLESISVMSIATCLLGVGDRHLENTLWCRAGGVCHVDWAALLQFGTAEVPPARLTRNILAVVDTAALESRLQQLLLVLRENQRLVLSSVRVAFHWMGEDFTEKYQYIEGLVRGTVLPHQVTREVIQRSSRPYREKYAELIDDVFRDFPAEPEKQYNVVAQVSSLLRQSTDPRILSVVRTGWEPWI